MSDSAFPPSFSAQKKAFRKVSSQTPSKAISPASIDSRDSLQFFLPLDKRIRRDCLDTASHCGKHRMKMQNSLAPLGIEQQVPTRILARARTHTHGEKENRSSMRLACRFSAMQSKMIHKSHKLTALVFRWGSRQWNKSRAIGLRYSRLALMRKITLVSHTVHTSLRMNLAGHRAACG